MGELRAKLGADSAMSAARAGCEASGVGVWLSCDSNGPGCGACGRRQGLAGLFTATRPHWCGGRRRVQGAWLRRLWTAAGPGWAIHSDKAPLVWRAPEGPEGQGGLRGAAPNAVRPPSLAGGRARRRPEHQRCHKQQRAAPKARSADGSRAGRRPRRSPALACGNPALQMRDGVSPTQSGGRV